jgi:hypothetical protein
LAFESGSQLWALGDSAFFGCSSLESICIPSSIQTISKACFNSCRRLLNLTFVRGSRIVNLCESAFGDCSSLQSICIPSSVETISDFCFQDCSNLSNLTMDSGSKLSVVGDYVFWKCWSLQSIYIPASLGQFSGSAVASSGIRRPDIDPGNRFLEISGDFVVGSSETCLVRYFGDFEEVTIWRTIKAISVGCFAECRWFPRLREALSGS